MELVVELHRKKYYAKEAIHNIKVVSPDCAPGTTESANSILSPPVYSITLQAEVPYEGVST
jgi:hypothetical protein